MKRTLASSHCAELHERGFCVISNLVPASTLPRIAAAYDRAFAEAAPPDLHTSSSGSNTRLTDLVNRGADFDELYKLEPVLEACASVIGASFKLSWQGARTVLPGARAQGLHVDVRADQDAWPLGNCSLRCSTAGIPARVVGFIVMVDEFRSDNGATRFLPGTHSAATLGTYSTNARPDSDRAELARGAPGSVIVYNGSTWHGFSANDSAAPRRSIQGAYIPRRATGVVDWAARLRPETAARLTASAK